MMEDYTQVNTIEDLENIVFNKMEITETYNDKDPVSWIPNVSELYSLKKIVTEPTAFKLYTINK